MTASQKIDTFKIFISWKTLYFFLYSVGILVLCALNDLWPVFSAISNNNLFLFAYGENFVIFFLCLYLQLWKKKYLFLNIFGIDLILLWFQAIQYKGNCVMNTKSIWKCCQSKQQPLNREILKILAKGGDSCLVGSSILRVDSIALIETMQ